jgi:hypothetical protein
VAEWFVQLDDRGLLLIATPQYFKEWKLNSSDEKANNAEHFSAEPSMAFAAERGIEQGETAGSLMWVALYAMLLELLDLEQIHLHQAEVPTPTSMRTPRAMANAYADDLTTLTCCQQISTGSSERQIGYLPSVHF